MRDRIVTVGDKGKAILYEFESPGDVARQFDAWRAKNPVHVKPHYDSFAGSSLAETLRGLAGQSPRYLKAAQRFQHKVPQMLSDMKVKQPHFNSGRLNYAQAMRGNARPCRAKMRKHVETAPVSLLFDVTVSAGVDAEQVERRGAAVLALAAALSVSRPVEIVLCSGMKHYGHMTSLYVMRFDMRSMPLAQLSWFLCSPALLRHVCFSSQNESGINWAFDNHEWQTSKLPDWVAENVCGGNDYIKVPGMFVTDRDHGDSDAAAQAWVSKEVARLTAA